MNETSPHKGNGAGGARPLLPTKRRRKAKRKLELQSSNTDAPAEQIPNASLRGATAANILTLATYDKKAAKQIFSKIRAEHFDDALYGLAFGRCQKYFKKYRKPPGEHLWNLLEKDLASPKRAQRELLTELILNIDEAHKAGLNRIYVLEQLNDFVADHVMRGAIIDAADAFKGGGWRSARKVLDQRLERVGSNKAGLLGRIREFAEFMQLESAPREDALGKLFQWPGISQITGFRGHGKTWLVLYVAVSLACGCDVFGWPCKRRYRVLLVDGEMPAFDLQKRLQAVCADIGARPKSGWLSVFSTYADDDGVPINLFDREQVDEIVEKARPYDVVIFDNIFSLTSGGDKNTAEVFEPLNQINLRLRGAGTLVIMVTHLGKDKKKGAFGSIAQELHLDSALQIAKTSPHTFHGNDTFEITCTKSRHHSQHSVVPVELVFEEGTHGTIHVEAHTARVSKVDTLAPLIAELMESGEWGDIVQAQFADEHGVHKSTVCRAAEKAAQGLQGKGK